MPGRRERQAWREREGEIVASDQRRLSRRPAFTGEGAVSQGVHWIREPFTVVPLCCITFTDRHIDAHIVTTAVRATRAGATQPCERGRYPEYPPG